MPNCAPIPESQCRAIPAADAAYRDIRANMEQTWNPEGLDYYGRIAAATGQMVYGESRTAAREPLAQWTRSVTIPVTAPRPGAVLILTFNRLAVVLLCPFGDAEDPP